MCPLSLSFRRLLKILTKYIFDLGGYRGYKSRTWGTMYPLSLSFRRLLKILTKYIFDLGGYRGYKSRTWGVQCTPLPLQVTVAEWLAHLTAV